MRRAGSIYLKLGLALLLLAAITFLSPAFVTGILGSEKVFIAGLHNSLYYLDRAKSQWLEEKNKLEPDVPTMEELAPYLGEWTNHIARFITLGITYRITSMEEPQSDVATLTRDLRFRSGYCRLYRAGTRYCLHTGWAHPVSGITSSSRAFYINNQELLAAALGVLGVGNLLVFVFKRIGIRRRRAEIPHQQGA
jgi:hypothetical protein